MYACVCVFLRSSMKRKQNDSFVYGKRKNLRVAYEFFSCWAIIKQHHKCVNVVISRVRYDGRVYIFYCTESEFGILTNASYKLNAKYSIYASIYLTWCRLSFTWRPFTTNYSVWKIGESQRKRIQTAREKYSESNFYQSRSSHLFWAHVHWTQSILVHGSVFWPIALKLINKLHEIEIECALTL